MIGLFFAALLALTFLSNTIQGMSLPKVAVDQPLTGGLSLNVTGDGFLQPAQTASLYAEGDWTARRIHVGKNDRVKKGDPLVTFDTSATQGTLLDEKARYEQKSLQLAKMTDQMKLALRSDDEAAIDNLKRDIRAQQLDMEVQQRKIAELERQIAEGGTLEATIDGVVTKLNASEGAVAGRGQPVVEIADDAAGYRFSIVADSNDAAALHIGDTVKIRLDEEPRRTIDGTISEIEDAADNAGGGSGKKITFDVLGSGLKPGLKASVDIRHQSKSFGVQIPKSALHNDNSGYYVFTVSEKEGPLGTAYYASKTYVTIKDENADTVVTDGLMSGEKYVTESSEPIGDGDRVRY